MKPRNLLLALLAAAMVACGGQPGDKQPEPPQADNARVPGDSTRYGLACDGCTDSVVVFLAGHDADPDTLNILQAMRERRVAGRPATGDNLAVVTAADDPHTALSVIDIDQLKGSWAYLAVPTLRRPVVDDGHGHTKEAPLPPDSVLQKLLVPREYGFMLKRNNTAQPFGMAASTGAGGEQSPVVYPRRRFYTEWHLYNGLLVLTQEGRTTARGTTPTVHDTAEIVMLRPDSLRLRIGGEEHGFYRKK